MEKYNYQTLLCFTDGNELHIAIGAIILKPSDTIYLFSDELPQNYADDIRSMLESKGFKGQIKMLSSRLKDEEPKNYGNTAVLANNCSQLADYKLLLTAVKKGADLYYADTSEGQVYAIKDNSPEAVPGGPVELEVDEVLEVQGFNIEESAEELMNSPVVGEMLEYVKKDRKRWDVLHGFIKNNYIINGDWIQFGTRLRVDYSEGSPMRSFVNFLEGRGYVAERLVTKSRLQLKIPNPAVRSFIQTTGLWLEALTYRIINSLPFIDDTKADVRFIWGQYPCGVVNEIDVMATSDSRMVFVSCKDIASLSTSMLNELEVYSKRIAGNRVVKILVSANKPTSPHFFERAQTMGIHVVWLGYDYDQFARVLTTILEQELC
ncbi:MAG: DUF1887 family CARF protein [Clostridia bacterium]|nr:DUF1887 family CARF protein [Clostridia bacterium]